MHTVVMAGMCATHKGIVHRTLQCRFAKVQHWPVLNVPNIQQPTYHLNVSAQARGFGMPDLSDLKAVCKLTAAAVWPASQASWCSLQV